MYERAPRPGGIEEVPFNPHHSSGFGWRSVEIDGQETFIHNTNNLSEVIWGFIITAEGRQAKTLSEMAYSDMILADATIRASIQRFINNYPYLFQSVYELAEQQHLEDTESPDVYLHISQPVSEISQEEKDLRDYYYSMAFDAIADEALQIYSEYEIENLCR